MTRKEMLKTLALTPLAGSVGSLRGTDAKTDEPLPTTASPLFPLESVNLLSGPFKKAQETNHQYLLSLEPDRLLHWNRKEAGLEPRADHYGGWQMNGGGSLTGHYLSACSRMYAVSGDEELRERVNYIVDELNECQQKLGTGALEVFDFNKLREEGFQYFQHNAAYPRFEGQGHSFYGTHKILAGLRDAHRYCDNQTARGVLVRLAEWVWKFSNQLTEEQFQTMLDVEHGGIVEVIADVYALTGDQNFFTLAKRFVHQRMAEPLADGEDILYPEHSNSNVAKFSGYARLHAVHSDDTAMERDAAVNFWDVVKQYHNLASGGHGEFERFGPAGECSHQLGYSAAETCCTYNMIKLTKNLYTLDAQTKYIDYYERALYNHLLGAIGPEEGMFCYFYSHMPGYFKTFSTPFDSMWCCVATGIENPAKYGQMIYTHHDDALYVNLFMASQLEWEEKGLILRQETRFPEEDTTTLTIEDAGKQEEIALKIRQPQWVDGKMQVTLNGRTYRYKTDERGYITIPRKWEAGDEVRITLPMNLHLETVPDNPHIAAIFCGPVLLAGDLGRAGMDEISQRTKNEWANDDVNIESVDVPVLVGSKDDLSSWIKPASQPLTFTIHNHHSSDTITLKPMYKIVEERYSIYWDLFSPDEWEQYNRDIDRYVLDSVRPGDQSDEEAHNLSGKHLISGSIHFRTFRGAQKPGSFSYDMNADTDQPLFLICEFWGGGFSPDPKGVYDILVDGVQIATFDLADERVSTDWVDNNHPMRFYEVIEPIPHQITEGKEVVTVKFVPLSEPNHPPENENKQEGQAMFVPVSEVRDEGIYFCRLVTAEGLNIPPLLRDRYI
jgi:DUF1680 family protein